MDSGQNKPKPSIFHAVNRIQRNLGRFWEKMDGHDRSRIQGKTREVSGYIGTGSRDMCCFLLKANKTNGFKFWWVNQIDGFWPKQTQAIYLPCCQSDTAKFRPVLGKNGWSRPIKDSGKDQGGLGIHRHGVSGHVLFLVESEQKQILFPPRRSERSAHAGSG